MKKILFSALVLSGMVAYAQEGKVGINTDAPTATLEVKSKTGATNATKNLELKNANSKVLLQVLDDGAVKVGDLAGSGKRTVVVNADGTLNAEVQGISNTSDYRLKRRFGNSREETCSASNLGDGFEVVDGYLWCGKKGAAYTWIYQGFYEQRIQNWSGMDGSGAPGITNDKAFIWYDSTKINIDQMNQKVIPYTQYKGVSKTEGGRKYIDLVIPDSELNNDDDDDYGSYYTPHRIQFNATSLYKIVQQNGQFYSIETTGNTPDANTSENVTQLMQNYLDYHSN